MGKKKLTISSSSTSARNKKENLEVQLRKLLKTPGFTDEYHDIFDPVIHGNLGIMAIRHSLFSKWKDPQKGSKFYKYNKSIAAHTNKLATLVGRLANLAVPEVFPCLEIVMLCVENYDENRKAIIKKTLRR